MADITMQADKLRELRELLAKATPGPWHRRTECEDQCCWHMHTAKDGVYGSRPEDGEEDGDLINYPELSEDDSALIVAAVNALPELLAIAEGAESDRADARRLRAFAQDVMETWPEAAPDGFDLQEYATKHGLLREVTMQGPCGEDCGCNEYLSAGDWPATCYRKATLLTGKPESDAAIDAALAGAVMQGEG